jgi:hypothetical protein
VRLTDPDRATIAGGVTISRRRQLVLNEVEGAGGPSEVLMNNSKWQARVSELPQIGSTELWEIVNLTEDAHPIHLHLVQFQLLNRQKFREEQYDADYFAAFPGGSLIPGYGPPRDYDTPNSDFAVGGNPARSLRTFAGRENRPNRERKGGKTPFEAFPARSPALSCAGPRSTRRCTPPDPGSTYIRSMLRSAPAMSGTVTSSTMRTMT